MNFSNDNTIFSFLTKNNFKIVKKIKLYNIDANWKDATIQLLTTLIPFFTLIILGGWINQYSGIFLPFYLIILGIYFHKISILLHDVAHMNFFPSKKYHFIFGNILAWICLTDFKSFRKSHMSHHGFAGENKDLEIGDFIKYGKKSDFIIYMIKNLTLQNLSNGNSSRFKVFFSTSLIGLFLTQSLIFLIIFIANKTFILGFCWILSALTFGVFFSRLRGVLEHYSQNSEKIITKSHYCGFLQNFIFFGSYMNYHAEHHLYPTLPSYHLPYLSNKIRPYMLKTSKSSSAIHSILSIL